MIIARSFARIHETNLKVRIAFFSHHSTCVELFTEAGGFAIVVRR